MAREMTDEQIRDTQSAWESVQRSCERLEDYSPHVVVLAVYEGDDPDRRVRNQKSILNTLRQVLAGIYKKQDHGK